jgi:hypothetical protein
MFNAYFDFALAEENRLAPSADARWAWSLVTTTALGAGLVLKRRWRRSASSRPKALSDK